MESVINSPLLYNLALTLIHFLWQGCLIALVLKLLFTITPYNKSQLRYACATGAMLASLIVPIITYFYIYQPNYHQSTLFADDVAAMISSHNMSSGNGISWYQDFVDSLPYVSMLWIVTVTVLASKLLIELYNVNRLPKQQVLTPNDDLAARFKVLSGQVGLRKAPRLLISLKADIPMAIGWLKPVILIPASMLSGLTPAQLDMLLLHELAHIRRHDYLVNFIQTLVETLLFFHPAVRWISKQMRNEREYCSDDIAVNISGNPIAYAHTLADTASICSKHRHHAIPNMAMAASGGDLKQRVVRLVDQHHCAATDDSGKFLASVLIVVSVLAVAVKPIFSNNLIDLTSGRISFFQTANEFIQQQPAVKTDLSATSIAQFLLQQDELNNKTQISVDKDTTKTPESKTKAVTAPVVRQQTQPEEIKQVSRQKANPSMAQTKTKQSANSVGSENSRIHQSSPSVSSAEKLLKEPQAEKSSSELAFERTDSSRTQAKVYNPYSLKVAELAKEPNYSKQDLLAEHELSSPVANKKRQTPRYTISKAEKPKVVTIKPRKRAAEILVSPDPRYPSTAKRKGIEIDVKVRFVIDVDGRVKDIEFEQKSKVSYFRSAIRNAMAKWRFIPAEHDGKPVESTMSKIFSFSLMK